MKKSMGFFPVFKAFMAIIYLLLGAAILIIPFSLLPVNNSMRIGFGILLVVYGLIRAYSSYVTYISPKKESER